MSSQEISVTYKWTAKPGKFDELKAIYEGVGKETEANEPGVPWMNCYVSPETGELIIQEVFQDAQALGMHFGGTAAQFFPQLLAIANPGPFFFCGDVPEEMKQAAAGMGLNAVFATRAFGFVR